MPKVSWHPEPQKLSLAQIAITLIYLGFLSIRDVPAHDMSNQ